MENGGLSMTEPKQTLDQYLREVFNHVKKEYDIALVEVEFETRNVGTSAKKDYIVTETDVRGYAL
jgi:hypothetical protein